MTEKAHCLFRHYFRCFSSVFTSNNPFQNIQKNHRVITNYVMFNHKIDYLKEIFCNIYQLNTYLNDFFHTPKL